MDHRRCLVAINNVAKSVLGPDGTTSNIALGTSTRLGRTVSKAEGWRFPLEWQQISGQHCRIFLEKGENQWYLEDTSTNGTYVNGERVPKHQRQPINIGDRIRFSTQVANGPGVPEYEFVETECETHPAVDGKRRQKSQDVVPGGGNPPKRTRYSGTGGATSYTVVPETVTAQQQVSEGHLLQNLAQLQKENKELQAKLEASQLKYLESEEKLQMAEAGLVKVRGSKDNPVEGCEEQGQHSNAEFMALEASVSAANAREKSLMDRLRDTEAKCRSLQELQQKLEEEASGWNVQCETLQSQCHDLKKALEVASSENKFSEEALADSRNRVSEMLVKSRQEALEKEKYKEKVVRLEDKLRLETQAVEAGKQEQEQMRRDFQDVKLKLKALEAAHAALLKSKLAVESEVEGCKRLHNEAREETKELKDRMHQQQGCLTSIASFATAVGTAARDLNRMGSELRQQIDEVLAGEDANPRNSQTHYNTDYARCPEKEQQLDGCGFLGTQINDPHVHEGENLKPLLETVGASDNSNDSWNVGADDAPRVNLTQLPVARNDAMAAGKPSRVDQQRPPALGTRIRQDLMDAAQGLQRSRGRAEDFDNTMDVDSQDIYDLDNSGTGPATGSGENMFIQEIELSYPHETLLGATQEGTPAKATQKVTIAGHRSPFESPDVGAVRTVPAAAKQQLRLDETQMSGDGGSCDENPPGSTFSMEGDSAPETADDFDDLA